MPRDSACPRLGEHERRYVYSIALRYVKDPDAADDVAQEALLLAHRYRDSFRGESRFSTWLYRIAVTAALMYLRKRRHLGRGEVRAESDEMARALERAAPGPSPLEVCVARERLAAIEARLATMGAKYREVFWMRFADGLSDGEVAAALSLGLSTVKTRTHRARLALRDLAAA